MTTATPVETSIARETDRLAAVYRQILADPTVDPRRLYDAARLQGDVERLPDGRWLVPASSGKAAYQIDAAARTCTCPDYQHRGVRCKHRLSVSVALLLERAEVEALDPTPLPIAGGADDADWQEQAPQGAPVQADAPIPLELTARGLLAVLLPGAAVAPLGVRRG